MSRIRRLAPSVILLAFVASRAGAQGWARTVGGDGRDRASAVQRIADGGFVVAGFTASFGNPTERPWVLRLDAAGSVVWQKSIGTGGKGAARCVAQATDGGFLVSGNSEAGTGGPPSLPWIVKLDGSGAITWQRSYDHVVDATLRAVTYLPDGSIAAVGTRYNGGYPVSWLLRLDVTGAPLRYDEYRVTSRLEALDVRPTADGGLLVAGTMNSQTLWLMQLDAAGIIVAQKALSFPFPTFGTVHALSLAPCTDGGWIIGGWRNEGFDLDDLYVPFMLKLDDRLGIAWATRLLPPIGALGAMASATCQTPDGGFLLAGSTATDDGPGPGVVAIKLDAGGAMEWQHEIGPGDLSAAGLAITPDGGGVLVGASSSWLPGDGLGDALLVRVDAAGMIGATCGEVSDTAFAPTAVTITAVDTSVVVTTPPARSQPTIAAAIDSTAALVELGDRHEPDDSCASPTRLLEEETARHDFCDDAEDWFELLACEGVTYTIMTSNLGLLANTVLEVLSPDCAATLASDDDGGGGLASRIDWVAQSDASYRVRVRQADATPGTDRQYDVTLLRSGPGCATWARTYGLVQDCGLGDRPSIDSRPDGSFIVAGSTGCGDWVNGSDAVVAALGPFGGVLWQERLPATSPQVITDIETTGSGGLVVAGASLSSNYSNFIVALDSEGAIRWQRSYQRDGVSAHNWRIRPLRDGGLAAVGDLNSSPIRSDLWVVRLDAAGIPSWDLLIGGRYWERAGDAIEMADGGLLVFAASDEFGELWLLRLDSGGSVLWQRACETGRFAVARAAEASDGGIRLVSGSCVLKLDRDGAVAWRHEFMRPPAEPFWASDLVATIDGGCAIAGGMEAPFSYYPTEPILIKLNAAGNVEWQHVVTQDELVYQGFLGISQAPDLGYVLTGSFLDLFVLRVDRDGRLRQCEFEDAGLVVSSPGTTWTDTGAVPLPGTVTVTDASFVTVDRGIAYDELCHASAARTPWEVSPPGSPEPLRFTDPGTLAWEQAAASGASTFNLYRGDVAGLRSGNYGACFISGLATNGATDPEMPPQGTIWTYLVTGRNVAGEGPMGRTSFGAARTNAFPCP